MTNQYYCSQHFQKIRKESRTGSPSVSSSTPPAVTPAKKRKSKVASLDEGNDDDDEESPSKTKSKRVKKENTKLSATQLGDEIEA